MRSMNHGSHRFRHVVSFALTSAVVSAAVFACDPDPDPGSPLTTGADAGRFDASSDPSPPQDAASEPVVDAGNDASPAPSVRADVTKDFATTANPNGAWTYGYSLGDPRAADAGALVVYSAVTNATPSIPAWYDPANSVLGAPAAWRNDSAGAVNGIQPGEFAMHPGNAGEYAVARWTAPSAGSYVVTVQFKAGDSGDTDGLLLHNGVALVTEVSTSTEAVHDLTVTLAAGDRLEAAVGPKGDFRFDSTPVRFSIRSAGLAP